MANTNLMYPLVILSAAKNLLLPSTVNRKLIYPFTHSLIYSFTNSLIYPSTHLPIYLPYTSTSI